MLALVKLFPNMLLPYAQDFFSRYARKENLGIAATTCLETAWQEPAFRSATIVLSLVMTIIANQLFLMSQLTIKYGRILFWWNEKIIFYSFKKEPAFYSSPPKTGNTRRSRSVSLRNNRKVGDLSDTTISSRYSGCLPSFFNSCGKREIIS